MKKCHGFTENRTQIASAENRTEIASALKKTLSHFKIEPSCTTKASPNQSHHWIRPNLSAFHFLLN